MFVNMVEHVSILVDLKCSVLVLLGSRGKGVKVKSLVLYVLDILMMWSPLVPLHIISHQCQSTISYHFIPYYTISSHTIPHHTIPYLNIFRAIMLTYSFSLTFLSMKLVFHIFQEGSRIVLSEFYCYKRKPGSKYL